MRSIDRDFLKKRIFLILFIIIIIALVVTIVLQIRYNVTVSRKLDSYEQLYEQVVTVAPEEDKIPVPSKDEKTEAGSTGETESESREEVAVYVKKNIDFEKLKSVNGDIIAWLSVPFTSIEYPVMRREDNSYYLNHNMDGSTGYPGCVYMESYNNEDFTDALSILYGHNMRNGSMFGALKEFRKQEYCDEHRELYLYLPDRSIRCSLVGATYYTDAHLLDMDIDVYSDGTYVFKGMSGLEAAAFWSTLSYRGDKNAIIMDGYTFSEGDRLLVLSTCSGNSGRRFLVAWKMEEE